MWNMSNFRGIFMWQTDFVIILLDSCNPVISSYGRVELKYKLFTVCPLSMGTTLEQDTTSILALYHSTTLTLILNLTNKLSLLSNPAFFQLRALAKVKPFLSFFNIEKVIVVRWGATSNVVEHEQDKTSHWQRDAGQIWQRDAGKNGQPFIVRQLSRYSSNHQAHQGRLLEWEMAMLILKYTLLS